MDSTRPSSGYRERLTDIRCEKCGTIVSGQIRYCTNCGNRLVNLGGSIPGETQQGGKVGALVGFLHGCIAAGWTYFIIPPTMSIMVRRMASDPFFASHQQSILTMFNTIFNVVVILLIPISAVLGYLFGILFLKIEGRIPGSSIIRKSIVFGFLLLAVTLVMSLRYVFDLKSPAYYPELFPLQVEGWTISLIEYPLLGWLFGYLLQRRLKPKTQ